MDGIKNQHIEVGKNIISGDYRGYDTSQIKEIMDALVELINEWYDDGIENANIRRALWEDVTCSLHIFLDVLYYWFGKLPSGAPPTTILNSLYNLLVIIMCYIRLHPKPQYAEEDFPKDVSPKVFGDDNLMGVADRAKEWFNQRTLTVEMLVFGLTYTNENKDNKEYDFRDISEVSFLKRKFRYDDVLCRYVAPLDINVVLEMPYWSKKGLLYDEITRGNVDICLMELSLHGESVFSRYAQTIIQSSRHIIGYQPISTDWESLLRMSNNREETW
jgi:hypothetical protein